MGEARELRLSDTDELVESMQQAVDVTQFELRHLI